MSVEYFGRLTMTANGPFAAAGWGSEDKSLVKVQKIIKDPNDRNATQPCLLIGNVGGRLLSFETFL